MWMSAISIEHARASARCAPLRPRMKLTSRSTASSRVMFVYAMGRSFASSFETILLDPPGTV